MARDILTDLAFENFFKCAAEKKDNSANQASMENQMPPGFGATNPMEISDDDLPF